MRVGSQSTDTGSILALPVAFEAHQTGIVVVDLIEILGVLPEGFSLFRSVQVIDAADDTDAMTADAYATAFMVLGSEEAKSLCAKVPGLEYFIICSDSIGDGYHPEYSEGFRQYLVTADK